MKKCKCGSEWGDNANFCGHCGEPLGIAEEPKQEFFHIVMFGNEGLEGYKVVNSESELPNGTIENMELRARMNSQRNISGYAFKSDIKVSPENITEEFLAKAMKIF